MLLSLGAVQNGALLDLTNLTHEGGAPISFYVTALCYTGQDGFCRNFYLFLFVYSIVQCLSNML